MPLTKLPSRASRFASALVLCAAASALAQDGPLVIYTPLASFGDSVYFGAYQAGNPSQLWRSDGTAEGTRKLRDFDVLVYPPPEQFTIVGAALFFFVDGALWRIDESGEPTLVRTLPFSDRPAEVAAAGSHLFFTIDDGVHGYELWASDGTSAGTSMVSDIEPGADGSGPNRLTPVGDTLFFFAFESAGGYSLWRTDGTESGTRRVRSIPGAGVGDGLTATVSGTLLFIASDPEVSILKFQLWRSDGTEEGTVPVQDFSSDVGHVCPGQCFPYGPSDLTPLGDMAFFIANDGVHGRELWKTDGTAAGTLLVKDVFPGPEAGVRFEIARAGGLAYFTGTDPDHGTELWRSDGSEAGTFLVKDFTPGPDSSFASPLAEFGGRLLFEPGNADELLSTGGAAGETRSIREFGPTSPGSGIMGGFASLGGGALLFVRVDDNGMTLWRTDGTENGTRLIPLQGGRSRNEIVPVEPHSRPTQAGSPRN